MSATSRPGTVPASDSTVLIRALWVLFAVSCAAVAVAWLAWGINDGLLLIPAGLLASALTCWYIRDLATGGRP